MQKPACLGAEALVAVCLAQMDGMCASLSAYTPCQHGVQYLTDWIVLIDHEPHCRSIPGRASQLGEHFEPQISTNKLVSIVLVYA